MRVLTCLLFFIASLVVACSYQGSKEKIIYRSDSYEAVIAFGSCAHSYDTLKIFDAINAQSPDVWIWLGDIMYGDSHDMKVLKDKYSRQKAKPQYQELLRHTKVVGIWDDHDYGINDGGKFYSKKDESKELLLDFLDVEQDDPVRTHKGVYSDFDIQLKDKYVKLILLDTRYFRDTLDPDTLSTARYLPNPDGDLLGEEQWLWLKNTLKSSKADFNIIGTGIQFIPEEQGYEKWGNFPAARKRMIDLLREVQPKPTLFISGDRHISEISRMEVDGLNYPLFDYTSSGLTHTWGMYWDEPNQYRVDSLVVAKNFGIIRIDLSENRPTVRLETRGEEDQLYLSRRIEY